MPSIHEFMFSLDQSHSPCFKSPKKKVTTQITEHVSYARGEWWSSREDERVGIFAGGTNNGRCWCDLHQHSDTVGFILSTTEKIFRYDNKHQVGC